MKEGQRLWTRDELILAINLFIKLTFGQMHHRNPKVKELAALLKRSTGSVARKLGNLARLDPKLQARGIKGLSKGGNLEIVVWNEFFQNENLPYESEQLLAKYSNTTIEKLNQIEESDLPKKGIERTRVIKYRVNQNLFREMIMSFYDCKCCVTGISKKELLVAGHISPWSIDEKNRMNPQNGIAINALHDRAFENGLITILPTYKIKISSLLKKSKDESVKNYFIKYDNQSIILPKRFYPAKEFLEYHNDVRFKK